jgi:hypothetical protein
MVKWGNIYREMEDKGRHGRNSETLVDPCSSPHGWLKLVWKTSDSWDMSQSGVRCFDYCVHRFKVAYAT